jgi:autophagy-related protein 5
VQTAGLSTKWIRTWYVLLFSLRFLDQERRKYSRDNQRVELTPPSSQIHLPRLSYLSTLLPRLHAFFSPFLIDPSVSPHTAWLSFENVALKYHYPIGLLHDLFSGAPPANPDDDGSEEAEGERGKPWKLVVGYAGFPVEQLMGLDAEERVVRDCYVNAVKEVCLYTYPSLLLLFAESELKLTYNRQM